MRRTLEGRRRDVLHLRADALLLDDDQSDLETEIGKSLGDETKETDQE